MTDADKLELLKQWHHARDMAKAWTDHEMMLRKQLVPAFFADTAANTVDVGHGYTLRGSFTMRHEVKDSPELRELVANFIAYPETSDVGHKLLKWHPRLSVTAWKSLPAWGAKLTLPFVTSTPNPPAIELLPPKE